jgi:hypothetical protein
MIRSVLFAFALAGCAYGPDGGYDDPQTEPQPAQNAAAVSHVPATTIPHERAVHPQRVAPVPAHELTQGDREPIIQNVE